MEKMKEKLEEKLKELNPDKIFAKFLKWFDSNKKMAFLIALLVGFITHITMITETIMSQDGLWNSMQYFRPGDWERSLGRWGLSIIGRLNFFIAIPSLTTMSCILSMAIAAVFLVDIFEFKSKISVIFTSLIVVLTPTLTVTLLYIYTAFGYCINFLISTMVIWFLYKFKYKKIGFALSVLLFMFSLSIYQSYIGVSIGLCVMMNILDLIRTKKTIKEIFINIGKAILVVILGALLYLGATKIVLTIYDLEFANYKGYGSDMGIVTILQNFGKSIYNAYKDFFLFFLGDTIVSNSNFRREIFYGVFLMISFITSIIAIVFMKEEDKKERIKKSVLASLFLLLLPMALNIVNIIVINNDMYALTASQLILVIPFTFAIFEYIDKANVLKCIAIMCCLYVMGTYYIANNVSYAALKLTYNQAYSTTMRILDRVENTEGYNREYPIMFGGIVGNDNYPRRSSLYTYTVGSVVPNPTFHGSYSGSLGTWHKFMHIFFGLDIPICPAERYQAILDSEEYKEMELFPGKDSVRVMDGIVVVKLSENPDRPF